MNSFTKPLNTPEFLENQICDKYIDFWGSYQEMCLKKPTTLNSSQTPSKSNTEQTNLRLLEAKLDGDWYFLLQDLLGNFLQKVKPGRISIKSNLNDIDFEEYYYTLAHIKCGPNKKNNFNVRLSTCIYLNGNEIQIPIEEVEKFEYADYYFFEKDGLFLLLNVKKFEQLNPIQKWFAVGEPTERSDKRFANYSFNVLTLLRCGCIDQFGYCDGVDIYKNDGKTSLLYLNSKGSRRKKYTGFTQTWIRGCQTSFKEAKYQAIYISPNPNTWEVIESSTMTGLVPVLTDKKGHKLSRQAYSAQARTNTQNFLENKISQKLSLSYAGIKPYFLVNAGFDKQELQRYIRKLYQSIEERKILHGLTDFLIEKGLKTNTTITKNNMSIHDYYEFIENKFTEVHGVFDLKIAEYKLSSRFKVKSNIESNFYKSRVAYFSNRKRGFLSQKDIKFLKIRILSGDNESHKDFYELFKKIKGNNLKVEKEIKNIIFSNDPNDIYYYNPEKTLDQNKIFSNLKTNIGNTTFSSKKDSS